MEERTRRYLRGRFGDHYRRVEITPPPDAGAREWGYIPWTEGPGTTMVRHKSHLDLGDLGEFLTRKRPRHVYFSAGTYDDPGAGSMNEKGWRGADLIFDLDADHLPGVDPETDSHAEMLAECKRALFRLLDFLEGDFGFSDLTVVFSGGRGYHVHVRDDAVQALGREARREVVDYVRGIGLEFDDLVVRTQRGTATGRVLRTDGGWGKRTHERLVALLEELNESGEDAAIERLRAMEGIGEKRAKTIYGVATERPDAVRAGNVELGGPGMRTLVRAVAREVIERENAPIDEPVTTDVNRLIRLPGSLHGGSALAVTRIDQADLPDFEPLRDAVPETFRGHEIWVDVTDPGPVTVGDDTFSVEAGPARLPEHAGLFLMARGRAEKGKEP